MLKKILITFLVVALCLGIYFPVSFFLKQKNEHGSPITNNEKEMESSDNRNQDGLSAPIDYTEDDYNEKEEGVIDDFLKDEDLPTQEEDISEASNFFVNPTSLDCIRQCEPYKYNEKEFEYCQNFCGLSPATKKEDCEKLKGLKKDYCTKNNAVIDKDLKECEKITDTKLKESCQKRIQESFIEENL